MKSAEWEIRFSVVSDPDYWPENCLNFKTPEDARLAAKMLAEMVEDHKAAIRQARAEVWEEAANMAEEWNPEIQHTLKDELRAKAKEEKE